MTSTTFFIIFIPILAILLLSINLLLAPHNPYQEKDSVFECGFHSFLGQNRTQFSISFFIFGLLFLLFDLEILLVYPYSVSSYTNDIYGLVVMMVFFVLLTLGFIFELGKNALTIDSRQTFFNNVDMSTPHAYLSILHDSVILRSSSYLQNLLSNFTIYVDTLGSGEELRERCKETGEMPVEVTAKTSKIVDKLHSEIVKRANQETEGANVSPDVASDVDNVLTEANIVKQKSAELLLEAVEAVSNSGLG
jgi:NADH-ubiquinone oxidoreductase chain 3